MEATYQAQLQNILTIVKDLSNSSLSNETKKVDLFIAIYNLLKHNRKNKKLLNDFKSELIKQVEQVTTYKILINDFKKLVNQVIRFLDLNISINLDNVYYSTLMQVIKTVSKIRNSKTNEKHYINKIELVYKKNRENLTRDKYSNLLISTLSEINKELLELSQDKELTANDIFKSITNKVLNLPDNEKQKLIDQIKATLVVEKISKIKASKIIDKVA